MMMNLIKFNTIYHEMNSINNLHNDLYKLMHYSTLKTEDNIIDKFISDFKNDFDMNIDESPEYVNDYIISYTKTLNMKNKAKINSNNDIKNLYCSHYLWLEKELCDDPIDIWICMLLYTVIVSNYIITKNKELYLNLKSSSSFEKLFKSAMVML